MRKRKLQLDKSSTPEREAEDFENDDDKAFRLSEMKHKLDVLKVNQGFIGRINGSCDAGINFALMLVFLLAVIIVALGVGVFYSQWYKEPLNLSITGLLAVAGYVFGKRK